MKRSLPNQSDVLEFISRRFPDDCNWLSGNCYYFAVILKDRFGGEIFYDPVDGHFFLKIDGVNYDYSGIYTQTKECQLRDIEQSDPLWHSRLINDCIR